MLQSKLRFFQSCAKPDVTEYSWILRKIKQPSHNETCDMTINIRSDVPLRIYSAQEFIHGLLLIYSNHPLIIA